MPTYQRFEDLPVWQTAIELADGCEDFLLAAKDRITWSKRDQLDRCSLSVFNNIAEGFERGTTNELLTFIYIARGSAGRPSPRRNPAEFLGSASKIQLFHRRQRRPWTANARLRDGRFL